MDNRITVLYRGDISSCNYHCSYCSFKNHRIIKADFHSDKADLENFITWIKKNDDVIFSVFFTPKGEILSLPEKHFKYNYDNYYIKGITELSGLSNIEKIVTQTNLSCGLDWLEQTRCEKLAFWCTYHPEQADLDEFLRKVNFLSTKSISLSAGIVGIKENFEIIKLLKARLPANVYLWVNAYKHKNYYSPEDIEFLIKIDKYFEINNSCHISSGKKCISGYSAFSIRNNGNIYRCHFDDEIIGDIKTSNIKSLMNEQTCKKNNCGCYIGYIFLERLGLDKIYGKGLLERNPDINFHD